MRDTTFKFYKKLIAASMTMFFMVNTLAVGPAFSQTALPRPSTMVNLTSGYNPTLIKGMRFYPENPLRFDFIVAPGDSGLNGQDFEQESTKLMKYFLSSLTVPEKDLWVNLSPYEKDRIIPEAYGKTEMGRDMLAQDYILKQLTSSVIYPDSELGKSFWAAAYQKMQEKFGSTDGGVNTFNKIWIVPEKAVVYSKDNIAYVVESHLKVMLEEDYLAMQNNGQKSAATSDNSVGSKLIRQMILPAIEKEVNEGRNFAPLRQVYHSLILATWFKRHLKESILSKVYVGQNKIDGVTFNDRTDKEKIYGDYLVAFKNGVYNFIREEEDVVTGEMIPRKYFSGGVEAYRVAEILVETNRASSAVFENGESGARLVTVDLERPSVQNVIPLRSPDPRTQDEFNLFSSARGGDRVVIAQFGISPDLIGYSPTPQEMFGQESPPLASGAQEKTAAGNIAQNLALTSLSSDQEYVVARAFGYNYEIAPIEALREQMRIAGEKSKALLSSVSQQIVSGAKELEQVAFIVDGQRPVELKDGVLYVDIKSVSNVTDRVDFEALKSELLSELTKAKRIADIKRRADEIIAERKIEIARNTAKEGESLEKEASQDTDVIAALFIKDNAQTIAEIMRVLVFYSEQIDPNNYILYNEDRYEGISEEQLRESLISRLPDEDFGLFKELLRALKGFSSMTDKPGPIIGNIFAHIENNPVLSAAAKIKGQYSPRALEMINSIFGQTYASNSFWHQSPLYVEHRVDPKSTTLREVIEAVYGADTEENRAAFLKSNPELNSDEVLVSRLERGEVLVYAVITNEQEEILSEQGTTQELKIKREGELPPLSNLDGFLDEENNDPEPKKITSSIPGFIKKMALIGALALSALFPSSDNFPTTVIPVVGPQAVAIETAPITPPASMAEAVKKEIPVFALKSQETVVEYTVKKGDTISQIAYRMGLNSVSDAQKIMAINGIEDPTKLQIGTVLKVPQVEVVQVEVQQDTPVNDVLAGIYGDNPTYQDLYGFFNSNTQYVLENVILKDSKINLMLQENKARQVIERITAPPQQRKKKVASLILPTPVSQQVAGGGGPDPNKDNVGGINLDPSGLEIVEGGEPFQFDIPIDPAILQNLQSEPVNGFVPVILNVVPIISLSKFLGVQN